MFRERYARAHGLASRSPRILLCVLLLLFGAAAAGLPRVQIDLSFRPLFATGGEAEYATREFERVFGQASGADAFVILEGQGTASGDAADVAQRIAQALETVPGIARVTSLQTLREDDRHRRDRVSNQVRPLVIMARLSPPLEALEERRAVIDGIRTRLAVLVPEGMTALVTGVSPVELEYETRILSGQMFATATTALLLLLLLWAAFGRLHSALLCLAPTGFSIVVLLGLMGWFKLPVTIISTAIPAIVLVIGVADAVHMHAAWCEARRRLDAREAADRMLAVTGRACWYTTLTTVAGFLSLLVAGLESVRHFGLIAATGIAAAYVANQAVLPMYSRNLRWQTPARCGRWTADLERRVLTLIAVSLRHPRVTVASFLVPIGLSLAALPHVIIDQRFNEELPRDDPVRVAQQQLEDEIGGFLGPEVSLRRIDGDTWAERRHLADLRRFLERLRELPGVERVESILDWLPEDERQWTASLDALERDAALATQLRERIDAGRAWLSISLRTGDIGTRAASELAARSTRLADAAFGGRVESRVVGQWWIAQLGMGRLLQDMLASLLTATAMIAPMLWLMFRRSRLFLAALFTNLLPVLAAIGFMAASGISLRIGTAVVLAVALGIAVDNTAHVGSWLTAAGGPSARSRGSTPLAVLITTLGLIAGFASMLGNELMVLRDMGLVAVVAFAAAFAVDLLLLPALYALTGERAPSPRSGNLPAATERLRIR